jgi:hypothetical protein
VAASLEVIGSLIPMQACGLIGMSLAAGGRVIGSHWVIGPDAGLRPDRDVIGGRGPRHWVIGPDAGLRPDRDVIESLSKAGPSLSSRRLVSRASVSHSPTPPHAHSSSRVSVPLVKISVDPWLPYCALSGK